MIQKEWLEFLREQYPAGYRVRLSKMRNNPAPIAPGSMGTLDYIDDAGQFHINWDDGRTLALEIGADRFRIGRESRPSTPGLLPGSRSERLLRK